MDFKIETYLNQWMAAGSTRVDAVFSLAPLVADGAAGAARPAVKVRRVVGLVLDCSSSMSEPSRNPKIDAMRPAAQVAIELLDAEDEFFVVAYATNSKVVIPLTKATPDSRRVAIRAIAGLQANGNTFISRALQDARAECSKAPGAVCQVLLLTDGQNNDGDARDLETALRASQGVYQAHCRGFGTDWDVAQLKGISQRLMGNVGLVAEPSKLADDFRATLAAAQAKNVADVRLRLFMPGSCKLKGMKQGFPVEIDITDKAQTVDNRSVEFMLGSFGNEAQDYCASFEVEARAVGEQVLVCRASVFSHDPATGKMVETAKAPPVVVQWTDDAGASARIDRQVAHYTGQAEKAQAIEEGLQALNIGDVATATAKLGRATQLAAASGDEETTRRLSKVVDVVDADQGTVTVRRKVAKADLMDLDAGATSTVRATQRTQN